MSSNPDEFTPDLRNGYPPKWRNIILSVEMRTKGGKDYQDQLPSWDEILAKPDSTVVPTSAGACAVLIFGAISKVEKASINPFMKYLERFEPEWQACFAINISKNPTKQAVAFSSPAFAKWVSTNEDIL